MGNTGYRFVISFFGLTMTIILLVNLILFSNMGFFGELQSSGDVYFGYSSFIKSFNLLEEIMQNRNMNGFWSMEAFYSCLEKLTDAIFLGFPTIFKKFSNFNFNVIISNGSVTPFPSTGTINNINSFFAYFKDVFSWFGQSLVNVYKYMISFGDVLQLFLKTIFNPILVIVYSLYLGSFVLYWIVIIFSWVVLLLRGGVTSSLPHANTSSWQDVVDYWNSQWSNLPQGLAIPL